MFSPAFKSLLHEATLTNEMLAAGATQIRNANYAARGVYFQAFTSLATGLERIGKLALILDHIADGHGALPDTVFFKHLKHKVGHNLRAIYSALREAQARRNMRVRFLSSLDHPIHSAVLSVLHDFAMGDRYSNISALAGTQQRDDPLATWHKTVDLPLFETSVKEHKKAEIRAKASAIGGVLGPYAMVLHFSELGSEITDLTEASYRTGVTLAVAPYRQLCVLQVLRYFVEILWCLEGLAHSAGSNDVPAMGEIFAAFYNDDTMFRSRKTWKL